VDAELSGDFTHFHPLRLLVDPLKEFQLLLVLLLDNFPPAGNDLGEDPNRVCWLPVLRLRRTSTLLRGACRVPGISVAVSPEFKRVVKWRISPVFVACQISGVKVERDQIRVRESDPFASGAGARWHPNCGSV
jgi:hypothetical protein